MFDGFWCGWNGEGLTGLISTRILLNSGISQFPGVEHMGGPNSLLYSGSWESLSLRQPSYAASISFLNLGTSISQPVTAIAVVTWKFWL